MAKTVLVTAGELLAVLEGRPVTFGTMEGDEEVIVRLGTADELLEKHWKACKGYDIEPSMTREQAEALAKPLGRA